MATSIGYEEYRPLPSDPYQWSVSDVSRWLKRSNFPSREFRHLLKTHEVDGAKLLDDKYINDNLRRYVSTGDEWSLFLECRRQLIKEIQKRRELMSSAADRNVHMTKVHSTSFSGPSNKPGEAFAVRDNNKDKVRQSVVHDDAPQRISSASNNSRRMDDRTGQYSINSAGVLNRTSKTFMVRDENEDISSKKQFTPSNDDRANNPEVRNNRRPMDVSNKSNETFQMHDNNRGTIHRPMSSRSIVKSTGLPISYERPVDNGSTHSSVYAPRVLNKPVRTMEVHTDSKNGTESINRQSALFESTPQRKESASVVHHNANSSQFSNKPTETVRMHDNNKDASKITHTVDSLTSHFNKDLKIGEDKEKKVTLKPSTIATASNNARGKIEGMRRVLFVGPTGTGKSTIINVLMNNDVTENAMSSPAAAGDTSSGVTAAFINYCDIPDSVYTDSIGLGDPRFKADNVMKSLKSVLKNSSIGYNKIYICIRYGRVSTDIRNYIDLITTIFGDHVLQWCSIIFTYCNDVQMTKEKYELKNSEDSNMIDIIRSVNTVIFGDNMIDQDPDIENVFRQRRQAFLKRIKDDLNETANRECFKLEKKNLSERMQKVMKLFHGSVDKFSTIINEILSFTKAFADIMSSSDYRTYFGECSICCDDVTDKNQPVITKCHHIYHEACLTQWIFGKHNKDCPICRKKFDDSTQKFFISLVTNE